MLNMKHEALVQRFFRTDRPLWTQQECLFRGDGVVPLASVTFFHE